MPRDISLYLADIIECCDRIAEYTGGHTLASFSQDHKTIDAVARNFEIMGEAVKNVPTEILEAQPEVHWSGVASFRDVIAHQYFRIKLTVVWDIVENELDGIRSAASVLYHLLPATDD
ncbi:MAG: DUF86 domain-containing protein [Chloracidobacterium sp.]|nr:DUF86 domain-containing protein [Chloracidobacterium sp.]